MLTVLASLHLGPTDPPAVPKGRRFRRLPRPRPRPRPRAFGGPGQGSRQRRFSSTSCSSVPYHRRPRRSEAKCPCWTCGSAEVQAWRCRCKEPSPRQAQACSYCIDQEQPATRVSNFSCWPQAQHRAFFVVRKKTFLLDLCISLSVHFIGVENKCECGCQDS